LSISGGEKNILLLPEIKPRLLGSPGHSPVTIMSYASPSPPTLHMLLFDASWHDGIDIKFLVGYHHGNLMIVATVFNGFKGDLT